MDLSSLKANKPRVLRDGGPLGTSIVECLPQVRTIKTTSFDDKFIPGRTYQLSFPYMQFYASIGGSGPGSVTFSNEPVENQQSIVYFPPLPCLHPWVCGISQSNNVYQFIEKFWDSAFYPNPNYEGMTMLRQIFGTFDEWEKRSLKDPSFVLKTRWTNQIEYFLKKQWWTG